MRGRLFRRTHFVKIHLRPKPRGLPRCFNSREPTTNDINLIRVHLLFIRQIRVTVWPEYQVCSPSHPRRNVCTHSTPPSCCNPHHQTTKPSPTNSPAQTSATKHPGPSASAQSRGPRPA